MTPPTRPRSAWPRLGLFLSIAAQAVSASPLTGPANKCHSDQYPGPQNPSFETGTLNGWQVLSGNTFGNASVSSATSYTDGPFGQVGKYFLYGSAQAGEAAVGQLRSTSFKASSAMSFLIGGGYDPENLYVALVSDQDNALLVKQTSVNDDALIRIVWDTSAWAGESVHVLVYDNSTTSHIDLDDVRTGCAALGDNGLTFQVLGQANVPIAGSQPNCSIYAADPYRPQYHYTPYQGWINDPAGLIQWNGYYHLFSQYYPYAPFWNQMYWSHAHSTDGVHWRELPTALFAPYPNNPSDLSGRYTGSAIRDDGDNGVLRLLFTEATDVAYHPGAVDETVYTATSSDGVTFDLYSGNPVIGQIPAGDSSGFRDPKAFVDPFDGSYKLLLGAGDPFTGKVDLYRSSDLVSWEFLGPMITGDGTLGTMWECPNLVNLGDDKWALTFGSVYADGHHQGNFLIGSYNGTNFTAEQTGIFDEGPDTYATQAFIDEQGRNLAITWMGSWDTPKMPSRINGFGGQQSLTRELFLRADGGLGARPIPEVASLAAGKPRTFTNKHVGNSSFTVGSMTSARLQVTVDLAATTAEAVRIDMFASSAESTVLTYTLANQTLSLDATNSGYGQRSYRQAVVDKSADNKLTLDIFLDRISMEIFVGDGRTLTVTAYPRYQESKDIKVTGVAGTAVFESIQLTPYGSSWC